MPPALAHKYFSPLDKAAVQRFFPSPPLNPHPLNPGHSHARPCALSRLLLVGPALPAANESPAL